MHFASPIFFPYKRTEKHIYEIMCKGFISNSQTISNIATIAIPMNLHGLKNINTYIYHMYLYDEER